MVLPTSGAMPTAPSIGSKIVSTPLLMSAMPTACTVPAAAPAPPTTRAAATTDPLRSALPVSMPGALPTAPSTGSIIVSMRDACLCFVVSKVQPGYAHHGFSTPLIALHGRS